VVETITIFLFMLYLETSDFYNPIKTNHGIRRNIFFWKEHLKDFKKIVG